MENIFLRFLNISITAGWIVLAVVILRLLLKKAPKWISCLLWAVVGLRLILPFSVESIFSLIPSTNTVDPGIVYQSQPTVNTGIDAVNSLVNPIISSTFAPDPINSANPLQIWTFIFSWVWVAGICVMLLYTLISYIRLRLKISTAVKLEDNIYQSERVTSPFILGIFRPRIYIPFALDMTEAEHVIAHEKAHLRRRDHLIKPIAFLLLALYWFNPLMWVAYILLCRDIELACDEKVIKAMADEERRDYSKALLDLSIKRMNIAACPLAFGEVGVKQRIKSVMNYKKPTFWIIIAALVVCVVVSVCFLTDPINDNSSYAARAELAELSKPDRFENAKRIRLVSPDNDVTVVIDEELEYIRKKISQLVISDNEISPDRSEDRASNYCIMVYYDDTHYIELNFNIGCREIWENDFVKPTLTYKVENPEVAKEIFKYNYTDPDVIQYDNVEYAILEHNRDAYLKGDVGVTVYRELLTEGRDGKMFIYLQVLYGEYSLNEENEVEQVSGGASPIRLTFEKGKSGYYCSEYYEPRGGDLYYKDLKNNFPPDAVTALTNLELDKVDLQSELDRKAEQKLTSISYHYSDPDNVMKSATLTLWGKDNFQFTYSMLSSNLCMGKYTKENGKLILKEDNSDKVYTFIINDKDTDTLTFDAENSSPLPEYKYGTYAESEVCLPDGAVFNAVVELYAGINSIEEMRPVTIYYSGEAVEYEIELNQRDALLIDEEEQHIVLHWYDEEKEGDDKVCCVSGFYRIEDEKLYLETSKKSTYVFDIGENTLTYNNALSTGYDYPQIPDNIVFSRWKED